MTVRAACNKEGLRQLRLRWRGLRLKGPIVVVFVGKRWPYGWGGNSRWQTTEHWGQVCRFVVVGQVMIYGGGVDGL
ncbi:hypothetical protein L484_014804 [Morus notabilis]|uniref:Uncharacterized protein n=1 Tax=Morus notabilis TaxID=981085 RepID=W9SI61_9ROSA|nr:hypothetical protein L484_014804 [Morus notabilis]